VGLQSGGFFANGRNILLLLPAIINLQAVFLLQFPAQVVTFAKIPERFPHGQPLLVDQVVSNMQMQIARIFMDAAMPLVFRQIQNSGETRLYRP
jgi:hypothetical protein